MQPFSKRITAQGYTKSNMFSKNSDTFKRIFCYPVDLFCPQRDAAAGSPDDPSHNWYVVFPLDTNPRRSIRRRCSSTAVNNMDRYCVYPAVLAESRAGLCSDQRPVFVAGSQLLRFQNPRGFRIFPERWLRPKNFKRLFAAANMELTL